MTIVLILAGHYVCIGLGFMIAYMTDMGRRISKKLGCSVMEGVYLFEKAGSTSSNIAAILYGMLIWPRLWMAMMDGTWERVMDNMSDEYERAYDDNSEDEKAR